MRKFRSPIPWLGGKNALAPKLLELMPGEYETYCEVFGGGASLLLAKDPSPVEVYNDLDDDLNNFFRVLRDPALFCDFYNRAWLTPYSRAEHAFCLEHLNDDPSRVERARRFFVLARYSFSGIIGNSFAVSLCARAGMADKANAYRNVLCMLPLISERLAGVEMECYDWRRILDIYDRPTTFFYIDPPYKPSTRKSGKYRRELTEEDHVELIKLLREIQGKVMLSGYPSELYDSLGWRCTTFEVTCAAAGRTRASGLQGAGACKEQKRTECVWMNY